MAKFDKKQFASALAEAICSNSMKCDNIASIDKGPIYNEETGEFIINMSGYENSNDFHGGFGDTRKPAPLTIFKLTFKIDMQQDPNYDPEDWV